MRVFHMCLTSCSSLILLFIFLFFKDTAPTEIYTLSLHDALPISVARTGLAKGAQVVIEGGPVASPAGAGGRQATDRKSTRLNSSHTVISYAVFCLKKKTT